MHANPDYCDTKAEESNGVSESGKPCKVITVDNKGTTFGDLWNEARDATTFWALARVGPKIVSGEVNYYFFIAPAAGLFVLFVLLQYCLDMALRLVKLAVYEVIAPIPIFARIMPNEQSKKVFSNWLKATISTFTEVFIRIAILYFAVFLISTVTSSLDDIFGTVFSGTARIDILLIAQALIIIGIIMFVKQAPEIIKEITGLDAGKYGKSLMKGIGMMTATLGGGATAMIRTAANDKDNHGFKKGFNAFKAGMGAGARGLWHGNKAEKFSDMPKAAGTAASNTLAKRAKVKAAGGNLKYLDEWRKDKAKDFEAWRTGGFEAQQKMIEQLNTITKEAETIKTNTEGAVKDKKYVFSMKDTFNEDGTLATPETHTSSTGETIVIDDTTSLSAVESIIKTLNGTGSVEDAKYADKLNNDIQKRAKEIGKRLSKVATGELSAEKLEENNIVKSVSGDITSKMFEVTDKMGVELNQAKQSFETLKDRIAENPTIASYESIKEKQIPDPVTGKRKIAEKLSDLEIDQSSDLADALKIESARIQREITLEQERRKAKEKK